MRSGCKVRESVVIQDAGNRIAHGAHDVLNRTLRLVGIRTVTALLVGRLADATDRSQRTIQDADDLPEGDLLRRFDEGVSAFHSTSTGEQACTLQRKKNLLEKFDWDVLASRDLMALQGRGAMDQGEFEECPQSVFAFL